MSLKFHAVQDGPSKYVLPMTGAMKCPVTAFLSPELYDASEENLWQQAAKAAEYEGALGLYLMPDCHLGYGIPVGGVLVTDSTIVQAGSGYDISCGSSAPWVSTTIPTGRSGGGYAMLSLKYDIKFEAKKKGFDGAEIKAEGKGGCDALAFVSIIRNGDEVHEGSKSIALFSFDGFDEGDIPDTEWFQIMSFIAAQVMDSNTCPQWQKDHAKRFFEGVQARVVGKGRN